MWASQGGAAGVAGTQQSVRGYAGGVAGTQESVLTSGGGCVQPPCEEGQEAGGEEEVGEGEGEGGRKAARGAGRGKGRGRRGGEGKENSDGLRGGDSADVMLTMGKGKGVAVPGCQDCRQQRVW